MSTFNLLHVYNQNLNQFKQLKHQSKLAESRIQRLDLEIAHQQNTNATHRSKVKLLQYQLQSTSSHDSMVSQIQNQQKTIAVLKIKLSQAEEKAARKSMQNRMVQQKLRDAIQEKREQAPGNNRRIKNGELVQQSIQKIQMALDTLQNQHQLKLHQLHFHHNQNISYYLKEEEKLTLAINGLIQQTENKRREHEKQMGILKAQLLSSGNYREAVRYSTIQVNQLDREIERTTEKINTFVTKKKYFEKESKELEVRGEEIRNEMVRIGVGEYQIKKEELIMKAKEIQTAIEGMREQIGVLEKQLERVMSAQCDLRHEVLLSQNREYLDSIRFQKDQVLKHAVTQLLNRLIRLKMSTSQYNTKQQQFKKLKECHQQLVAKYQLVLLNHSTLQKNISLRCQNYKQTLQELRQNYKKERDIANVEHKEQKRTVATETAREVATGTGTTSWKRMAYQFQYFVLISLAGIWGYSLLPYL